MFGRRNSCSHLTVLSIVLLIGLHFYGVFAQPNSNATSTDKRNLLRFSRVEFFVDVKFDIISRHILQISNEIGTYLAENYDEKTQVFSPLSIVSALSMLFLGSKGITYEEFMNYLGYSESGYFQSNSSEIHEAFGELIDKVLKEVGGDSRGTDKNRIEIANGIFLADTFNLRPTYKDAIESTYDAEVNTLDFIGNESISRDYINNWVLKKTHEKIKTIFDDPIDRKTRMIIASSLYFLGFWKVTFYEEYTKNDTFYPNGVNHPGVIVQMMKNNDNLPYYYSRDYDCDIIGLPYRGDHLIMYVIVPRNSSRERLKEFQKTLTAYQIDEMILKMTSRMVYLTLPKLNVENTIDLKTVFQEKGLGSIFSETGCDLSLISENNLESVSPQPLERQDLKTNEHNALQELESLRRTELKNPHLYVDSIMHKVSLTVNEKGTEGGAVTYGAARRMVPLPVTVNTPYIFFIRHEPTRSPIFYGTVFEPTQSPDSE